MNENFSEYHSYTESKTNVPVKLNFSFSKNTGNDIIDVSESVRSQILFNHLDDLNNEFENAIIEKLSKGNEEGQESKEMVFNVIIGGKCDPSVVGEEIQVDLPVEVIVDWEIVSHTSLEYNDQLKKENIIKCDFSVEKNVNFDIEIEADIDENEEDEEITDYVNLENAKNYILSSIISNIESGDVEGKEYIHLDSVDYRVEWKID